MIRATTPAAHATATAISGTVADALAQRHRTGLDGWSPLELHEADLAGCETQRAALVDVAATFAPNLQSPSIVSSARTAARAGDRLLHDQPTRTPEFSGRSGRSAAAGFGAHHDPRLTWLLRSLSAEAWAYLQRSGHDLDDLELRVERTEASVLEPGASIPAQARHDADLTAVYVVAAPEGAGSLRLLNTAQQHHADFPAVEGRLTIFPARQRHEVLENLGSTPRVAFVFDLRVARCSQGCSCGRPGAVPSPGARVLERPSGLASRVLAPRPGLEPLEDIAGPMTSATSVQGLGAQGSSSAEPCAVAAGLPAAATTWTRFRHAAASLRSELEQRGIDTACCVVSTPSVSWRREDGVGLFAAAPTDVQVFVRLDDGTEPCVVEYESGGHVSIERGEVVIVTGHRRHRVVGHGVLMRFGANLPSPEATAAFDPLGGPAGDMARAVTAADATWSAPQAPHSELADLDPADLAEFMIVGTRSRGNRHRRNLFPVG